MSELSIELSEDRCYRPGQELLGHASWRLEAQPEYLELRLLWFTRGKGTTDSQIVQTLRFDQPALQERRGFSLMLPDAPFSFSGVLISLVWALELAAIPGPTATRAEIAIAPTGQPIRLAAVKPSGGSPPPAQSPTPAADPDAE